MVTIVDMNNYCRMRMLSSQFAGLRVLIHEIHNLGADFLVWDSGPSNEKRRKIYPEYKLGRQGMLDAEYETLNLIRNELAPYLGSVTLQAYGVEADDVIAYFAKHYPTVTIISTDLDLAAIPNAINPLVKKEKIAEIGGKSRIRLYKTLVGDRSDNIKGLPKFGDTAWKKMSDETKDILETSFTQGYLAYMEDEKLAKRLCENWDTLMSYWKIVGFMDFDINLLSSQGGKWNEKRINDILDEKGVL